MPAAPLRTSTGLADRSTDPYPRIVGVATHQVIGALVARRGEPVEDLLDAAWVLAGQIIGPAPIARRTRAARLAVAGGAGIYVTRFIPPSDCHLVGVELPVGSHRIDLGWEDDFVLFDEIKTADARAASTSQGPTLRQVQAYAEVGRSTYGARFAGVRLLFLGAASRSVLVRPDGRLIPLADTPFVFGRQI